MAQTDAQHHSHIDYKLCGLVLGKMLLYPLVQLVLLLFFKRYKLNRAAQLLSERKYNVSEIADMTGFSTLSHFSTSFKKQFGVSPSEYIK